MSDTTQPAALMASQSIEPQNNPNTEPSVTVESSSSSQSKVGESHATTKAVILDNFMNMQLDSNDVKLTHFTAPSAPCITTSAGDFPIVQGNQTFVDTSIEPTVKAESTSSSSCRVGEMERDAVISHGLLDFVHDHKKLNADVKHTYVNTHTGHLSALPGEDTMTVQPAIAMKQWDHMISALPGGIPYSLRSSVRNIPSNSSSSSSSMSHLVLPNYNNSSSSSHTVIPNYNNSNSSSSSVPPVRPRTTSYDDAENKEDGVSMSQVQGEQYPESELSIDEYLSRSRDATRRQKVYVDSESDDDDVTYGERWGTSYNSYTAQKATYKNDNVEGHIENYMKAAGQTGVEGKSMFNNYKNPNDARGRITRIMNLNEKDIKLADWVSAVADSNYDHIQERITFYNRAIVALNNQMEPAYLVTIAAKCAAKMSADIGIPVNPIVGNVYGVIHTLYLDFRHEIDIRVTLSFSRNYMRIHSPMGNGKHSYDTMQDFDKALSDTMNQLIAYVLDETTVSKVKNQKAMSLEMQEPAYDKLHLALYDELQEQYSKTITTLMVEEEEMKVMLAAKQEQIDACRRCKGILLERNAELMNSSVISSSSSSSSSSSASKQVTFAPIPERDM